MKRFEHGPDLKIKRKFTGIPFTSFQDMYKKVLKVERVNQEVDANYKARMSRKRKMQVVNSLGGCFNKKPFPLRNNGEGSQSKPYYHKCKSRHYGTCNCPVRACFGCGEIGQMVARYPKIDPVAQGAPGGVGARQSMPITPTQAKGSRASYGGRDKKPQNQTRVFAITVEEEDPNAMI